MNASGKQGTISNCARCGGSHENLTVKHFTTNNDIYHAWAMCPTTEEPILYRQAEVPAKDESETNSTLFESFRILCSNELRMTLETMSCNADSLVDGEEPRKGKKTILLTGTVN